jgi:hypothetical protein
LSRFVARARRGALWIAPDHRGIVLARASGVSLMKIRHLVGLAVAVTALAAAAVARAEDGARVPPWAIRLEPGGFFTPDHLHAYSLVGVPPPAYLGVSVERTIAGPLRANVSGGASPLLGWLVGGTVRYSAVEAGTGANVSIGVGPLFAPNADFGAAAFAQVDATLQLQLAGSFGVVLGGSLGIALNDARGVKCGVDTCEAYLARGDTVGSLRVGIGWAF